MRRGRRAWSVCWRPAGTSRRPGRHRPGPRAWAWTPPWACIRTSPPVSTAATATRLADLAAAPEVVAIGETGLDYDRGLSPGDVQLENLRWHIELAFETRKPLILHCRSAKGERDAQDDLVRELREAGVGGSTWTARFGGRPPAVLHSFSGPVDYGEACLAMGCAVSISGLAFRAGEEADRRGRAARPRRRGCWSRPTRPTCRHPGAPRRRNEPRWVEVTARWVAEQRAEDPEALGETLVRAYDATFAPIPG